MRFTKHIFLLLLLAPMLLRGQNPVVPIGVNTQPLTALYAKPRDLTALNGRFFSIYLERDPFSVYRSDDAGASWTAAGSFPGIPYSIEAHNGRVFMVSYEAPVGQRIVRVYRTEDQGLSFQEVHTVEVATDSLPPNSVNALSVPRLFAAGNAVFLWYTVGSPATGPTAPESLAGYYSTDDGATWTPLDPTVASYRGPWNVLFHDGRYYLLAGSTNQCRVVMADSPAFSNAVEIPVTTNSFNYNVFAEHNDTLYLVDINGDVLSTPANAAPQPFTKKSGAFPTYEVGAANGFVYSLYRSTLYRAPLADPAAATPVYTAATGESEYWQLPIDLYAFGDTLVWNIHHYPLISFDNGLTWQPWQQPGPLPSAGYVHAAGGMLAMDARYLWRSTNGTAFSIWQPQGLPFGQLARVLWERLTAHQGYLFVPAFTEDDETRIALFRSADQGLTWTAAGDFQTGLAYFHNQLVSTGNRLYFNTFNQAGTATALHYTDDAGATWQPLPTTPTYPSAVGAQGDTVYFCRGNRLIFTYDRGQTYDTTVTTLTNGRYVFARGPRLTLASSSGQVFGSTDAGQSVFQITTLPGGSNEGLQLWPVHDSLLLGFNYPNVYVGKIGSNRWVRLVDPANWTNVFSVTYFNDYLYGGRSLNGWLHDHPKYVRVAWSEVLDQLNALSDEAGLLSGRAYLDNNLNCTYDAGDHALAGHVLSVQPGNITVATGADGRYSQAVPPGSYSVNIDTPRYHLPACTVPAGTVVTGQQTMRDVVFQPDGDPVFDLGITISGSRLRPGAITTLWITVTNHGTLPSPAGAALTLNYDAGILTFQSALPGPDGLAPGNLQFTLPSIPQYGTLTLRVQLRLAPDPALTNQSLFFTAGITDDYGDANLPDNSAVFTDRVRNSFDPNDKTPITPAPDGAQVAHADRWIEYQIRFQNTGTDTAFRVVLRDTLSARFDPATLRLIDASHPYRFALRANRVLEWHFDPIALPDSTTDEPGSHGFARFAVRARPNVKLDEVLTNRAAIYFDYNPPVITNTATTRVVRRIVYREARPAPLADAVRLYPNPMREAAVLEWNGEAAPDAWLELYDGSGRLVRQEPVAAGTHLLRRGHLPAGGYAWRLVTVEGRAVGEGIVRVVD